MYGLIHFLTDMLNILKFEVKLPLLSSNYLKPLTGCIYFLNKFSQFFGFVVVGGSFSVFFFETAF